MKFKQFLTEGYFLQIRGKLGLRFGKEGDWEFKITSIDLLSGLRDKLTKSITVYFPIEAVNDTFMQQIQEILDENRENAEAQNCKLNFEVYDAEKGLKLELPSKNQKINPNNQFLNKIREINFVDYRLN